MLYVFITYLHQNTSMATRMKIVQQQQNGLIV